jgi:tetratricopeptide (TPR) repeat protein
VIPVLLPGANPESISSFPLFLRERMVIDMHTGLRDDRAWRRLVSAIESSKFGTEIAREKQTADEQSSLGLDHVAQDFNILAGLLMSQGDYFGARPLYERALAITEKALGAEHPDTVAALNNLAGVLVSQGDYLEARRLYERALVITEKVLGAEHPACVAGR